MFELECDEFASALRIFWDIVNVTIGFNVQESSSSHLGMFYEIVPRTAFECQLETSKPKIAGLRSHQTLMRKCLTRVKESVTFFQAMVKLQIGTRQIVCMCLGLYFSFFSWQPQSLSSHSVCVNMNFLWHQEREKSKLAFYCVSFENILYLG